MKQREERKKKQERDGDLCLMPGALIFLLLFFFRLVLCKIYDKAHLGLIEVTELKD